MPLKKIVLKPGVNRENTRYTTEGGWYDCDKIRFRQGTPEKIGGWLRISEQTYLGICRSLNNWVTLGGVNIVSLGTNLKFYDGGYYIVFTTGMLMFVSQTERMTKFVKNQALSVPFISKCAGIKTEIHAGHVARA